MSFVQKAVERMKKRNGDKPDSQPVTQATGHQQEPLAKVMPVDDPMGTTLAGFRVEVDQERLRREGFLAPAAYQRQLAEEYRHIKRPLLANAFGVGVPKVQGANLVMVASALSGEGKTRTCINLALSMAQERDRTVLLVDADVAKPTVSRLFGLQDHLGLLDLLAGDCSDLREVLVATDVPKLRILPAGKPREHATELLASERMRDIAEDLGTRYPNRIILFDSPPLLATTESVVLAGLVGQIALVVAAGTTPREAARQAVGLMDPDKAINVILNKSRRAGGDSYGYGYGYGQYGHHGKTENDETQTGP